MKLPSRQKLNIPPGTHVLLANHVNSNKLCTMLLLNHPKRIYCNLMLGVPGSQEENSLFVFYSIFQGRGKNSRSLSKAGRSLGNKMFFLRNCSRYIFYHQALL